MVFQMDVASRSKKCLKPAFFIKYTRGRLDSFLSSSLRYLSKDFSDDIMCSVASFKSCQVEHEVLFVNYGNFKISQRRIIQDMLTG